MDMTQMTTMKSRIMAAMDLVGLEIVRLADIRQKLRDILVEIDNSVDAEISSKAQFTTDTEKAVSPTVAGPAKEYMQSVPTTSRASRKGSRTKPPMRQAIMQVMGSKTMNADQVLELLKEKGWAPNAQDPRAYVAHRMCSLKDTFEPDREKGRGFYRVRRPANETTLGKDAEQILEELGIDKAAVSKPFDE